MEAATLATAMGCSISVANTYITDVNTALIQARCTTINRAAMYCAQVGHESAGLRYMEEIASGAAYEGRQDLGNTQPGDGKRFKGRGPIQLTGRHNYGEFGKWAKAQGLVPDANYFLNNPTTVASSKWGFLAAAWYWVIARPQLNDYADAADVLAATKAINGGTNGLTDRQARWTRCRQLGSALLPTPKEIDMQQNEKLTDAGPGTIAHNLLNTNQVINNATYGLAAQQKQIAALAAAITKLSAAVTNLAKKVGA